MMQMYDFIYDSFLPCVPRPWPVLRWRRTARWELGSRWPPASPWGCSLWAALWAGSAGGDPAPTLRRGRGGFIGRGKESHNKNICSCARLPKEKTPRINVSLYSSAILSSQQYFWFVQYKSVFFQHYKQQSASTLWAWDAVIGMRKIIIAKITHAHVA